MAAAHAVQFFSGSHSHLQLLDLRSQLSGWRKRYDELVVKLMPGMRKRQVPNGEFEMTAPDRCCNL